MSIVAPKFAEPVGGGRGILPLVIPRKLVSIEGHIDVLDLIVLAGMAPGRGVARDLCAQGGVFVNSRKIDPQFSLIDPCNEREIKLLVGKRYFACTLEPAGAWPPSIETMVDDPAREELKDRKGRPIQNPERGTLEPLLWAYFDLTRELRTDPERWRPDKQENLDMLHQVDDLAKTIQALRP